jgi:hypothetical protein
MKLDTYQRGFQPLQEPTSIIATRPVKLFWLAFILANLVLSSYFLDAWRTPNAASRAIPVLTLYEDRSLIIDKYHHWTGDKAYLNQHYYSDKAPLSTYLVYPFYIIYKSISSVPDDVDRINQYPIYIWEPKGTQDARSSLVPNLTVPLLLGSFLCGTVPFVLLVVLTFRHVHKLDSAVPPVLLTMTSFYGTFLFGLSGVYFGHLLSGIFLVFAYLSIKAQRHYFIAGFLVGLAFLTEYTTLVAAPIWLALIYYHTRDIRPAALFASGIVPALAFILYYNQITTGSAFDLLYNHPAGRAFAAMKESLGFGGPRLDAVVGLLFSQYRGLFYYAPPMILIVYYLARKLWEYRFEAITNNYLFLFCLVYFLMIASYYMWWGGWSLGPRHLVPIVMLMMFEGLIHLAKQDFSRRVFGLLAALGIALMWMAKSTRIYMFPDQPTRYSRPLFDLMIPDFLQQKFNANNFLTMAFGIRPEWGIVFWPILFVGLAWSLNKWHERLVATNLLVLVPTTPVRKLPSRRGGRRKTKRRKRK